MMPVVDALERYGPLKDSVLAQLAVAVDVKVGLCCLALDSESRGRGSTEVVLAAAKTRLVVTSYTRPERVWTLGLPREVINRAASTTPAKCLSRAPAPTKSQSIGRRE
jgi:hypothetical protein